MKDIKDYLYLHLGCDVITPDGNGWLASVSRDRRKMDGLLLSTTVKVDFPTIRLTENSIDGYDKKRNHGHYLINPEGYVGLKAPAGTPPDFILPGGIKPILRPLSDMTDEDQKFFGCDDEYFEHMKTMTHQIIHLHTDEFHYLLKQHFDLFGLIESGLAISKVNQERIAKRDTPKDETWKQKLADHTCHHKFEDMNTSEMEVAEFVAGTISGEGIKDESVDVLAHSYLIRQFVDYGDLNNRAEEQITEAFKAGYAANQKGQSDSEAEKDKIIQLIKEKWIEQFGELSHELNDIDGYFIAGLVSDALEDYEGQSDSDAVAFKDWCKENTQLGNFYNGKLMTSEQLYDIFKNSKP